MSHHFRNHHVMHTSKFSHTGGRLNSMTVIRGGAVYDVKQVRDPRTNKIHHIPIHGAGVYSDYIEPTVKSLRKHINRFQIGQVPTALARALSGSVSGGAVVRMI